MEIPGVFFLSILVNFRYIIIMNLLKNTNYSIGVAFSKFPEATKTIMQIYMNVILQFQGYVNTILGTEKPKEYRIKHHIEAFSGSYYERFEDFSRVLF